METIHVNTPVKCIADLLRICETYELAENVRYNIDMKALHKIYPHLRELNNMIGMNAIKQTIVDQIMYFVQRLHLTPTVENTVSPALPPIHITNFKAKRKHKASTQVPVPSTPETTTSGKPLFTFGGTGGGNNIANSNSNSMNRNDTNEEPLSALFSFFVSDTIKEKEKPTNPNETKKAAASSSSSNVFKFPANAIFAPAFLGPQPSFFSAASSALSPSSKKELSEAGDYMHTVLYGPPGTGKTEVAKILGNIFCNLGILKSNTFKKVTRSDLVAGYLGQTAIKTREVIEAAIGGVLFIDEAYALGNTEKRDSFSKECIDTLCEALSDHKHELMVIIAGYEKELNDCFFSYNEGLSSRFTWRYKIENYDAVELRKIFEKIMKDNHWTFDSNERDAVKDEWFKSRVQYFKYFGRDIEVFFTKTKIAHSRRVFYLPETHRRKLTMKDLDAGFELFTAADDVKSRGQLLSGPAVTMYL
jgi:chromosomal replication initiation ATPase DnaA